MNVPIPIELESFVQSVIATGTYHDPAEVVGDALRLLARREEPRKGVSESIAQIDRGEFDEYREGAIEEFLTDIRAEEKKRFPEYGPQG